VLLAAFWIIDLMIIVQHLCHQYAATTTRQKFRRKAIGFFMVATGVLSLIFTAPEKSPF
jgi:hypothetical protein